MTSRIETVIGELLAAKRITLDEFIAIVAVVQVVGESNQAHTIQLVAGQVGYRAMGTLKELSKES